MTTIDRLPNNILKEIFKEVPNHTMIIRIVCRRWCSLVQKYQTILAALYWRNVKSLAAPNKSIYVELSIEHELEHIIRHYCEIKSDLLCELAAKHGQLEVLKQARASGCLWGTQVCDLAVSNGHFKVLKWARANGCPWGTVAYTYTRAYVAESGHLEVIKWAYTNGYP